MPHKLTLLLLLSIVLYACKKDQVVDCTTKELRTLRFGFETNLGEWEALGGKIEVKDSSNITMSNDIALSGTKSAKFIVSPDSYLNGGVRSELSFDQQIEEGVETFYEYSIYIPTDYLDAPGLRASDGPPN